MFKKIFIVTLTLMAVVYGQTSVSAADFASAGVFNTPVGDSKPGPLTPGKAFEFTVNAEPGDHLTIAMMFGQSNDFFYAPKEAGIALYNGKKPISKDVTSQVELWDAGTEVNQEPGAGPDQAPRQKAPNTGAADPDNKVRIASDTFKNLPKTSKVLKVMVTHTSGNEFKVRVENISQGNVLKSSAGDGPVVIAPGVWVVHAKPAPLFMNGKSNYGNGLEPLAEDGNPAMMATWLSTKTVSKMMMPENMESPYQQ
jgi:hypothetical protein